MEEDAVTKIQQRIAELPADVQAAIQSSELHTKVITLGSKYQLHIDQVGELEDEVMLAMLGFAPLEGMAMQLARVLGITPEVAEKLVADITTEIFGSIRESMKKFAATKAQAAIPMPAQTAPAAVTTPVPSMTPAVSPTPLAAPAMPPMSPDMHKADVVLSEKTVSTPPPAAAPTAAPINATPTPPIYKADPYREPI